MPDPDFGAQLRAHRHAANLTLEALGERSGVSPRTISDMERGRSRGPQARTVEALADALGLAGDEREALVVAAGRGRVRPQPVPTTAALPNVDELFVGRDVERRQLADGLVAAAGARPVVVSGPGGIGKTTLVVRVARDIADDFPDGTHFVALAGQTATPLAPAIVASRLLVANGMSEGDVPRTEAERFAALADLLGQRRALVVLDDARDEAQVRPLLAHRGGSAVLISSRRTLGGLDASARVTLEPMTDPDAADLLAHVLGAAYDSSHRGLGELAEVCGRFPLALRIAANRLLSRPGWSVQTMLDRLADESVRLNRLRAGDVRMETTFALSYAQLRPVEQLVFRRLALIEGTSWSVPAAAVLSELPEPDADAILDDLVELQLITATPDGRHAFHDLLRLYAADRLTADEPPAAVERARMRHRDWLLAVAQDAGAWFEPGRTGGTLLGTPAVDPDAARRWLQTENEHWFAALQSAAAAGDDRTVVDVAESMHWYSDLVPMWDGWHDVFDLARQAAHRLGDVGMEATQTNYLAWVFGYPQLDAERSLEFALRASALAAQAEDGVQLAWAEFYLNNAHNLLGHHAEALAAAEAATAAFRQAGDLTGEIGSVQGAAISLIKLGRPDDCIRRTEQVFALVDAHPDLPAGIAVHARATSYAINGDAHFAAGRPAEAFESYRSSIRVWDEGNSPVQRQRVVIQLATALAESGDLAGALPVAHEALQLALANPDPSTEQRATRLIEEIALGAVQPRLTRVSDEA